MKPAEKLKTYLWGALAGFTITVALLLPQWQKSVTAAVDWQSQHGELVTALEKQLADTRTCLDSLEASTSGATILYQQEPPSALQIVASATARNALGLDTPVHAAAPLPRWVIPGRVTPILIGPPRGEVFYHARDGKGMEQAAGPFTPQGPRP